MTADLHPSAGRFTAAVRELAAAQKPGAGVPAYTRYVNRPLGRLVAAAASVVGATPNQVSAASGVLSLVSIAVLAVFPPSWPLGLAVGLGLIMGYVLDSADGQLARLGGGGSFRGEWLDHVIDSARMPVVHMGVLVAVYRFYPDLAVGFLLVPLGYLLVSVVRFFALMLAEQMRRYARQQPDPGTPSDRSLLRSLIALPGDFGVLCLVFLAWGSLPVFLVTYTVLFAGNAAMFLPSLTRRYRELRLLEKSA